MTPTPAFSTGDADVDQALGKLEELDERPLDEHADVYADIHRSLGSVLDGGSRARRPLGLTPPMARRLRLDAELVRRSLARSREHASELIAAGRVTVGGATATKPATGVTTDVAIVVTERRVRAGLRLARRPQTRRCAGRLRAVRADGRGPGWRSTPAHRQAASPTSFSGAVLPSVVAVDVGYGQLAWSIRQDPRVIVLDRTNVRELTR